MDILQNISKIAPNWIKYRNKHPFWIKIDQIITLKVPLTLILIYLTDPYPPENSTEIAKTPQNSPKYIKIANFKSLKVG